MRICKKISLILLTLILSLSLLAVGCDNNKDRSEKEPLKTVRLNEVVHSIFYSPQYVALELGFFEEEGLKIDLATGWGGDKSMTALVSNTADIALIGSETSIYVLKRGSDQKIINFAELTQTDGSFLVGREAIKDFKLEDLKGKTVIGGRRGGIPEMVMEYVLKNNNLTPHQDVDIIQNIALTATTGAFKGGTGDFVQLFEPNASLLEKENIGHVVASFGKEAGKVSYTVFMATDSYMNENPEVIQKFTNAIYKGQIWCENHSAEEIANVIKPQFPDDELDIVQRAVERYKEQKSWAPNPIVQEKAVDRLQDIMINGEELDQKVPFADIVNNTFAEKAVKDIPLPKK